MIYLAEYRTHQSVEEMNESVKQHILNNKLTGNVRKVFECIAKHSLKHPGASHIKGETIAKEVGISRSTVTRCVKTLKDSNVITSHNIGKGNGIKGANIYSIIFLSHCEPTGEPTEMSQRVTHANTRSSKLDTHKIESESLSFNLSLNPFVVNNVVNNVDAYGSSQDLKFILKEVYKPSSEQQERDFEELCKIGFGRLKQFMKFYNLPYLQIKEIVINCMKQLVKKTNVNNIFAMYSRMIERQVKQLFEKPVAPQFKQQASYKQYSKEQVPEWFESRNEQVKPSTDDTDFEAARLKILAKLG